MAIDKAVDSAQLDQNLADVADAIRSKGGTSLPLDFPGGFVAAIEDIQTGENLPTVSLPKPQISVSADGTIAASVTQEQTGKVTQGAYASNTLKQNTVPGQTITPGTEDQRIPPYHYTTGAQVIEGDPNLLPENIVKGKTIFGVDGTASTGVEQPDSLALDPDVVYATTRPKDWLPMPTPGDDEIYVLCHIPDGLSGQFGGSLTITGAATVEFGTIIDGAFAAKETVDLSGSGTVKKDLSSNDYGDITAEGYKQCMVRIKGAVTFFDGALNDILQSAVELVCGIKLDRIRLGYTADEDRCWFNLRYISFVGDGGANNLSEAFYYCNALVCVRCEKPNVVNAVNSLFRNCFSLQAVSDNFIAGSDGAVNGAHMLRSRSGLRVIPRFLLKLSSCTYLFYETSLSIIDMTNIDTSLCADISQMFRFGYPIREIKNFNISSATTAQQAFSHLGRLYRFTLAGDTTPGGLTIDLSSAKELCHTALLETINSLPPATATATLNISGVAGASELTDDEIAIATAKNWTITI